MSRLAAAALVLCAVAGASLVAAEPPARPAPRAAQREEPPVPGPLAVAPVAETPRPPDLPAAGQPPAAAERGGGPALGPVSVTWAALRLVGATVGVGMLLLATLAGYRRLVGRAGRRPAVAGGRLAWLARWMPAAPIGPEAIEVLSRSYLGPRESIGLVQVGHERFLVGVSAAGISLLARLGSAEVAPEREDPTPADFAAELHEAGGPRGDVSELAIRAAVARSRDRLARAGRLVSLSVSGRNPRD